MYTYIISFCLGSCITNFFSVAQRGTNRKLKSNQIGDREQEDKLVFGGAYEQQVQRGKGKAMQTMYQQATKKGGYVQAKCRGLCVANRKVDEDMHNCWQVKRDGSR